MSETTASGVTQSAIEKVETTAQRILVRDLTLSCKLGVSERERAKYQRIRINIEVEVDAARPIHDDPEHIVDYRNIVPAVRHLTQSTTPLLLETLADQIAAICLEDPRSQTCKIRIEKLDRYADAAGIGVEVEHRRRPA
jgi:dihydroneopterin aldolase